MSRRTAFLILIGIDEKIPYNFAKLSSEIACPLFDNGDGCTMTQSKGLWKENNVIHSQNNIELRFSIMPNLENSFLQDFQNHISNINRKYNLNLKYIHIEKQTTNACHLELKINT